MSDDEILCWTDRLRDDFRTSGLGAFDPELAERLALAYEAGIRRLCALPLSDPFWYPSNMTPTPWKVAELAVRQWRADPLDAGAVWTSLVFAVERGQPPTVVSAVRPLLAADAGNLRWLMSSVAWLHDNGLPFDLHELAWHLAAARDADPRLREMLHTPRQPNDPRAGRALRAARFLMRRR